MLGGLNTRYHHKLAAILKRQRLVLAVVKTRLEQHFVKECLFNHFGWILEIQPFRLTEKNVEIEQNGGYGCVSKTS